MSNDVLQFQKENVEGPLRLVPERADAFDLDDIQKQFVNFTYLRVSPDWRKLDSEAKRIYKAEFVSVFESFRDEFLLYTYSLVGFDSKADLMFWRVGTSLDLVQEMTVKLFRTNLGRYFETTDNYLAITKRMMFIDNGSEDRQRVQAGTKKYHFFYPCAKQQEWFEMSESERDLLIEENFMVGKRFPNIRIHMTYAFGFTNNEYLISFETDEPKDFLALAEELRVTQASRFTLRGMPIFTCRQRPLIECLDALG